MVRLPLWQFVTIAFALALLATAAPYVAFARVVVRSKDTQSAKRWRVAVVLTCILALALTAILVVCIAFALMTADPPLALSKLVRVDYGLLLASMCAVVLGVLQTILMLIGTTALIAMRFKLDFDNLLERIWFEWGWKNWLGRDLPDANIRPLMH